MRNSFKRVVGIVLLFLTVTVALGSSQALAQVWEVSAVDVPSLREIYKDYFEIGAAVSIAGWSSKTFDTHRDLIKHHFSSLTAENEMKPDALQGRPGVFGFNDANKMVDFAMEQGMVVRGHTLVWHAQTGDWFFRDKEGKLIYDKEEITEEDRQLVIERLENHIEVVLNHFGDKVYAWDVVNETVNDGGESIHRPDSPWYRILGDDFMNIAFEKAHQVLPEIKLFYNDYNPEMVYKRGRTVKMLKSLLEAGVPVHGIGIQGHWSVDGTSIQEIEEAINMYADLGLEIHITEMDVGMKGFTAEQQAERFRDLFQLFKKYSDVITSVTLWGISDDASWRGDDDPLLFDRNHLPKPSYWALVDTDQPWYINMAEHVGAVAFVNEEGEVQGYLKSGDYKMADLAALGFTLDDIARLELVKSHTITFYAEENHKGDSWRFVTSRDIDGEMLAAEAASFSISPVARRR